MVEDGSGGATPLGLDDTLPVDERNPVAAEPLTRIGHFVVLQRLGQGGMGVVYKAYDNALDRKVAIKLLRDGGGLGASGRARMLREAQSMARLSHPNVVHVYEVGEFRGQIFVAMEYLEGETVRQWLATERRSWRDVLQVYVQAGRGLEAAHQAGIVHRDFKPDNVVVCDDGRVCVLDFGLAVMGESATASPVVDEGGNLPNDGAATSRTATGAILGTPAYMSPEQHRGVGVDAASDQFSFCAALHEGLYGVLPFAGTTLLEIRQRALDGQMTPVPVDSRVPRLLLRGLRRGLSVTPDERFPSMAALMTALTPEPASRRRWLALALLSSAVLGLVLWSGLRTPGERPNPCLHAADKLASRWNPERIQEMESAFLATGRSHAADTLQRTNTVLDRYSRDWAGMRVDTCEATRVRGEQSEQLLDLRMQCLDQRLERMGALVDSLTRGVTGEVVDQALTAAYQLPSLDRCRDADALRALAPLPEDATKRAHIDQLYQGLRRAEAFQSAGRYRDARAQIDEILAPARDLGYGPLTAGILYQLGRLLNANGRAEAAQQHLLEAAKLGSSVGDDASSAESWIELISVIGHTQGRFEIAEWLAHTAEAAVLRAGQQPLLRARLLTERAGVAFAAGQYREALSRHQAALAIRLEVLGDMHPDVAASLSHMGANQYHSGEMSAARPNMERALAIRTAALGPRHPVVGQSHINLGGVLVALQDYERAREHFLEALEILESVVAEGRETGALHNNLGELHWFLGRPEVALEHYTKALGILEKVHGSSHPFTAYALAGLGQALVALGRPEAAIARLQRALTIREQSKAAPGELAVVRFYLHRAHWHAGSQTPERLQQAQAAYEAYRQAPEGLQAEAALMEEWLRTVQAGN